MEGGDGKWPFVIRACIGELSADKKDPRGSPGADMLVSRGMDSTASRPIQVSPRFPLASPDLCLGIVLSLGTELNQNKWPLDGFELSKPFYGMSPAYCHLVTFALKKKSASS